MADDGKPNYVRKVLLDSLITGVPQIVDATNLTRRWLKSLVLVLCIVGFIYQTTEFLKIFYSYPTVLDIDVEYPTVIMSPAITYCNLNGINRRKFCGRYPDRCIRPTNETAFCSTFPEICDHDENLVFPFHEWMRYEESISPDELRHLGHDSRHTLFLCAQPHQNKLCSLENMIHTTIPDGNTGRRNCYTLFSNLNSSSLNRFQIPVPKSKDPLFHMVLNAEQVEYFRPDRQAGIMVSVHSPHNVINPFFNGFVVQPGRLYTVHLKVVEKKLLPSPYDTKCRDYRSEWQNRGNRGPLTQEMCVSECIFNASVKFCSCVIPDMLYVHEERVCDKDDLDCFDFNISGCYSDCPQPCDFTDYEYEVQERKLENPDIPDVDSLINSKMSHFAVVLIYLKRPEIVIYSHRPQYEDIEVFSFIGGFVGMWLGITLVAVYDFLESIVLIGRYWIQSKLPLKKKRPLQHPLQN